MSADVLRQAASLMRERAEGTTQGAQWSGGNYWITDYDPSDPSGQTAMQRLVGGMEEADAPHYSSWHPAVALAVADWLEEVADMRRTISGLATYSGNDPDGGSDCFIAQETRALAVARAYLEESA